MVETHAWLSLILTWITRHPYGWVDSTTTWPWKDDKMKPMLSGGTHSIHFWITWFPFWSLTHCITCPSSSEISRICCSESITSNACHKKTGRYSKQLLVKMNLTKEAFLEEMEVSYTFCMTRQPYIWRLKLRTWPTSFSASSDLCSGLPCSKNCKQRLLGWVLV